MENHYFVDSDKLSEAALKKKHMLETDPSSRTNHMEYMEGMERIKSDIMDKVMTEMKNYDYSQYTARDVNAALNHETCSHPYISLITVRITAFTAALTVIMI